MSGTRTFTEVKPARQACAIHALVNAREALCCAINLSPLRRPKGRLNRCDIRSGGYGYNRTVIVLGGCWTGVKPRLIYNCSNVYTITVALLVLFTTRLFDVSDLMPL